MRAIRRVVVGTVLMVSLGAVPAAAQAKFSLGGGLTLPMGDFGDGSKTGFHGLAAIGFQPANLPIGIQVDGMYQRFGVDVDDFDAHTQVIQGTANAVYTFTTSEASTFHPYLIGGVGIYNSKLSGDDVPDAG